MNNNGLPVSQYIPWVIAVDHRGLSHLWYFNQIYDFIEILYICLHFLSYQAAVLL